MVTLLLIVIYLAFISLGLPDSLLGVAWPAIQQDWNLPLDAAGLISVVSIGFTVLSSLLNGHIVKKIGTGKLTFISGLMTGCALLGISFAPSFIWIIFLAIPLGFGGGSVDASLNNYVASHFKSHHMNWLHSFWGVGATIGPIIMGSYLLDKSWQQGYRTIAYIQILLAGILLLSLPLWAKHKDNTIAANNGVEEILEPDKHILQKKGIIFALGTFVFYVAVEMSVGLWGSSYLVQIKNISVDTAAKWIALYYGGITFGRFISGFISFKLNNIQMIRYGTLISLIGGIILILPVPNFLLMTSFVLIGMGFAPIFPGMIHETPTRFGKNNSAVIIGYQMAAAYSGSAIIPPLLGVLGRRISMNVFPLFVLLTILMVLIFSEILTVKTVKKINQKNDNTLQ